MGFAYYALPTFLFEKGVYARTYGKRAFMCVLDAIRCGVRLCPLEFSLRDWLGFPYWFIFFSCALRPLLWIRCTSYRLGLWAVCSSVFVFSFFLFFIFFFLVFFLLSYVPDVPGFSPCTHMLRAIASSRVLLQFENINNTGMYRSYVRNDSHMLCLRTTYSIFSSENQTQQPP